MSDLSDDHKSYAESHRIRPTIATGAMLALGVLYAGGIGPGYTPRVRRRKRYAATPDRIDRGPKVSGKVRNLPCPKCGAKLKRHAGGKCPVGVSND
jgi:hypothetical protein